MNRSHWLIVLGIWLIVGIVGAAVYSVETFVPAWALLSLGYIYIFAAQRAIGVLVSKTN